MYMMSEAFISDVYEQLTWADASIVCVTGDTGDKYTLQ